jgi:large subunit ribosomal protein L6
MSRIGKSPIPLPKGVEATIAQGQIAIKGPLGTLSRALADSVKVEKDGENLMVIAQEGMPAGGAMSGTTRALVANMVTGVTKGFERKLNLVGVGYRAQAQGDKLNLTLGFSHPVVHPMPKGIKVETPTQTEIIVKGNDKQLVGQVAAEIRAYRPPEPYKGKGVRYSDERVVIKETKKK